MSKITNPLINSRILAALQLLYVADALAMPVHWFYNPQDIKKEFPEGVQQFEAAPQHHPHDFLTLSNTDENNIVGNIILKGKRQFWGVPNQHVHCGMKAGENTLNAHCARLVTRVLNENNGHYDIDKFLDNYIEFMTAVIPQHPDTYAESYHRGFFTHLVAGISRKECGLVADSTASVGGFVTLAPIAISELLIDRDLLRVQIVCREHLHLTHPDENLAKVCDAYIELIDSLLFREENDDAKLLIASTAKISAGVDLEQLCQNNMDDNEVIGSVYAKSCGIENAWPSLLYLAYKYNQQPKKALLVNANVGGENCHRGSVLGVIMGLSTSDGLNNLFNQLIDASSIRQEIMRSINNISR